MSGAVGAPLQVFEAHARRIPPLGPYLRELWRRRRFVIHMARMNLRAASYDTFFGQLWQVLNPLLLASVYYFVFGVILGGNRGNPQYLAVLLSGLFAFYFTRNAIGLGAGSIVGGGRLIMNTAFPRALLPLSAIMSAVLLYIPSLAVYALFHVLGGQPIGRQLVFLPLVVAIHIVFNFGLALGFAAVTVYFRDTSSFLPYLLRIWLYLSPVLYAIEDVPERFRPFLGANPLYPLFGVWHQILVEGVPPSRALLGYAALWAIVTLVLGSWFFLSREREFAVRI
jgi:teichoic acid transport system permease protein